MALSIISFAALLPSAETDAAQARMYVGKKGLDYAGGWSDPDGMIFYFTKADGSVDRFTGAEMREVTWWYWLRGDIALSIEAHLFPLPDDTNVYYVARADNSKNGILIRDSLLSEFFIGRDMRDTAYAEARRLRQEQPDAAVFSSSTVEQAERILASSSVNAEGTLIYRERMSVARATRFEGGVHHGD